MAFGVELGPKICDWGSISPFSSPDNNYPCLHTVLQFHNYPTQWSNVFDKITVLELVKKFSTLYTTFMFRRGRYTILLYET
jgi:hypothetical protein